MADIKISELNAAPEAASSDLLIADRDKGGGVLETQKLTLAQVLTWLRSAQDGRYGLAGTAGDQHRDNDGNDARFRKQSDSVPLADISGHGTAAAVDTGTDPTEVPTNADVNAIVALLLQGGANASFATMPQVVGSPIVSSGSTNAGSWTQWADGTMICAAIGATSITIGSQQNGALYTQQAPFSVWDFPKIFASTPMCMGAARADVEEAGAWSTYAVVGNVTTSELSSISTAYKAGFKATVDYIAIGRWK